VDETAGYYVKWNKPGMQYQNASFLLYVWCKNAEFMQLENRLMDAEARENEEEGWWKADQCRLGQRSFEVLLHSGVTIDNSNAYFKNLEERILNAFTINNKCLRKKVSLTWF
jgi:hypothetical protein